MPRIGITCSVHPDDGPEAAEKLRYYRAAVEDAGGTPVFLRNDLRAVAQSLASIDGLLFTGGPDVDPARYGGNAHAPNLDRPRPERDAFELALIDAARRERVPMLCICRGMQTLNVALGGTLIEDLPSESSTPRGLAHAQDGATRTQYQPDHYVVIEPCSRLAMVAEAERILTNSLHHQALRAVAPGLEVVARATDGVIEAVEAPGDHWTVGVQWHPECLDDAPSKNLFAALVDVASARALVARNASLKRA